MQSIQTTDCLEYKINATFYKKKEMLKSHEIKEKNNGIDYFFFVSFRIPRGKVTFHRYCYFDLRCFECQFRRKMHENIIIMSIISSDEILAFMIYVDNAKNDNVVEVFFEFAYEVQISTNNLFRNRHH